MRGDYDKVMRGIMIKLIHPIRKGNGLHLADSEFLTLQESAALLERMRQLANEHGWTPGLRMTTWTPETEGYSILVYPDGSSWSWPVYGGLAELGDQGGPEDVAYLGDLKEEPITEIWKRYTFKLNHLRKYLDVCGDLKLDVSQPELAHGSMTKLQRAFLEHQRELIREQLLTLNVRHSLSTALVACLGLGLVEAGAQNVNDLVHQEMWDLVEYIRSEPFEALLSPRH